MSSRDPHPPQESVYTRFWQETPENDNPFAAALCRCAGYDVYGDLLGKASHIEYLYLLFHGEKPGPVQAQLLDSLALALANPGPRDNSVQAAMSGGAGGSTLASCLMAAIAVGAGGYGGAREAYEILLLWEQCGQNEKTWRDHLSRWQGSTPREYSGELPPMDSVWPAMEHPPGFDPYGKGCPTPVRQTLDHLSQLASQLGPGSSLCWLREHRQQLESVTGMPLAISGVAAAALADLNFDPQQGEALYLLLRLPGAAVHALEQHWEGCHRFPFYRDGIDVINDPGPVRQTEEATL